MIQDYSERKYDIWHIIVKIKTFRTQMYKLVNARRVGSIKSSFFKRNVLSVIIYSRARKLIYISFKKFSLIVICYNLLIYIYIFGDLPAFLINLRGTTLSIT